jgi:hypothetical protein
MGYYCVSNMRFVALQDTPLAWLKAGIGWHRVACFNVKGVWSTWAGSNVREEEKACLERRKGYSQVPGAVDACLDVKK